MSLLLGKIRPGGYIFSQFWDPPPTSSYNFILALSSVEIKYICPKEGPKQDLKFPGIPKEIRRF